MTPSTTRSEAPPSNGNGRGQPPSRSGKLLWRLEEYWQDLDPNLQLRDILRLLGATGKVPTDRVLIEKLDAALPEDDS